MKICIFLAALIAVWIAAISAQAQIEPSMIGPSAKLTALMATRVTINESSFAIQCVPWERRERCITDLGAILQRTEFMARRSQRTMYDELRRHSPRATGRCMELWALRTRPEDMPRRCHAQPRGNVRWVPFLNLELTETLAWRTVYPELPWETRRPRFERTLRDAMRWLSEPWYPCGDGAEIETWAGRMDAIGPAFEVVSCGNSRNRFVKRIRRVRGRQLPDLVDQGTVPASVARGDLG